MTIILVIIVFYYVKIVLNKISVFKMYNFLNQYIVGTKNL